MSNVISIDKRTEVLNNLGDYGEADFNVYTRPVRYVGTNGDIKSVTNKKILVRDDNHESVGVVGNKYEVAQHPDAFRTVERIIARSDLDVTDISREINVSHDGARAYAIYTLPSHSIDLGDGDISTLQISTRNSFDGSWCFHIDVGAVRIICLNGQVFLNDFAMFKARHTAGLNMEHAARKLSKAIDVYQHQADVWSTWRDTPMGDSEAFGIFAKVADCKFITRTKAMAYPNVAELLLEPEVFRNKTLIRLWEHYVTDERKNLGSTMWAVYNAMTHWATHEQATKSTAQKNIAAIQVARQDRIRKAVKNTLFQSAA